MNKAVQAVIDSSKKIEDVEITFSGDSVQITWQNLQVHCDAKSFDRVFNAVKVLSDNGAYFV